MAKLKVAESLLNGKESKPLLEEENDLTHATFRDHDNNVSKGQKIKTKNQSLEKWRNFVGFWLFGICTNFPYVVMLSSAYDILDNLTNIDNDPDEIYNSSCSLLFNETTNSSDYAPRDCLTHGTYEVLLADVLPSLVIKLILPFFIHHVSFWIRVSCVIVFAITSFIIVAMGPNISTILLGVVCASISTGLGEITFLALTARYDKFTVVGWSSGTGAAGVIGSLSYTGLSSFLSPHNSLLLQIVIPFIMLASYMLVITKPRTTVIEEDAKESESSNQLEFEDSSHSKKLDLRFCGLVGKLVSCLRLENLYAKSEMSVGQHIKLMPKLIIKYMMWLFLVYIAEYMINQSLFESLYYPNTKLVQYCLDQSTQYKWYQVMYQIGVFISRSSIALVHIKYFQLMAFLQVLNFVLLFLEVIFQVVPFFWITLFYVLYEGILGGAVYANVFYSISQTVDLPQREFSMSVVSAADALGIAAAALLSMFIHQFICSLEY